MKECVQLLRSQNQRLNGKYIKRTILGIDYNANVTIPDSTVINDWTDTTYTRLECVEKIETRHKMLHVILHTFN